MFNFFKSNEEKREEQISAYIDQQMSAAERQGFETLLGQDADLREQVEAQQEVKALLSKMPKLKAPRNFVLDPAVYGGKAPAPSFFEQLYPKMRLATAAASFLFVIVLGAGLLLGGPLQAPQSSPAADVAAIPAQATATANILSAERNSAVELQQADVVETELDLAESDESSGAGVMMGDEAIGEALMEAAEVADDSGAAEMSAELQIESPRLEEADAIEGERLIETTPLPEPEPDKAEGDAAVADLKLEIDPDNQTYNSQSAESAVEFRTTEAQSSNSNWLPTTLWALGILTALLILATFFIGRRVD